MNLATCRYCGQSIRFITSRETGRKVPVDPNSVLIENADARQPIITEQGIRISEPALGEIGYLPHNYTCTKRTI